MKKSLTAKAFIHALGELVYISGVATVMMNGERIFGQMKGSIAGPVAFLLLFVISALISGLLILGKPILLFMDGAKKEALHMLLATAGFLILFFIIGIFLLMMRFSSAM